MVPATDSRLNLLRAAKFFLVVFILGSNYFRDCDACLCHLVPNYTCPPPPHCCESGQYTFDECGCCLTCAKSELQPCGGASGSAGKCAQGLACLKTCTACKTIGSNPEPCIFPFDYLGHTFDKCTTIDSLDSGSAWCATEIYENRTVVDGRWGDCDEGCPGARHPCDDLRFSILIGKCINPNVPGAIPNWIGAPPYRLLDKTKDLFPAPLCSSENSKRRRLYDNTCRCAEGEDAIEVDDDGSVRGNCTGVDNVDGDKVNTVWCFLENIRDPSDPTSGCYTDTTWSPRDGRFWSAEACNGLPALDSDESEKSSFPLGEKNPLFQAALNTPFRRPEEIFEIKTRNPSESTTRPPRQKTTTASGDIEESVTSDDSSDLSIIEDYRAFFEDDDEFTISRNSESAESSTTLSTREGRNPIEDSDFYADDFSDFQDLDDLYYFDSSNVASSTPQVLMNLPIVNQRENGVQFLPTPLPSQRHRQRIVDFNNVDKIIKATDPPPLTTSKSTESLKYVDTTDIVDSDDDLKLENITEIIDTTEAGDNHVDNAESNERSTDLSASQDIALDLQADTTEGDVDTTASDVDITATEVETSTTSTMITETTSQSTHSDVKSVNLETSVAQETKNNSIDSTKKLKTNDVTTNELLEKTTTESRGVTGTILPVDDVITTTKAGDVTDNDDPDITAPFATSKVTTTTEPSTEQNSDKSTVSTVDTTTVSTSEELTTLQSEESTLVTDVTQAHRSPKSQDIHKVDLGILGSFWLEKAVQVGDVSETERPSPIFKLEDYTDKYPV